MRVISYIAIAMMLCSTACAAWDANKPADNRRYDLQDDDIRANFAALEDIFGIVDSDANVPYVYNVKAYGAEGDGTTNDTTAIQNTIDAAESSTAGVGVVYFPPGTYMISGLDIPAPCIMKGCAGKFPTLKVITGTTGNVIEDTGSAQGIWVRDLQFDGNDQDVNCITLGYNTSQHGGLASLQNLYIRDCNGYALQVNGNASIYQNIWCTGEANQPNKLRINGIMNVWQGVQHTGTGNYGVEVYGLGNLIQGLHIEGAYSTAGILVDGDNNQFVGISQSVDDSESVGACIQFASGEYGNTVTQLSQYIETGGSATMCIDDDSFGSREHPGWTGINSNHLYVPYYRSGRHSNEAVALTGAPTTGTWRIGDWARHRESASGEAVEWRCIAHGSPGTWVDAVEVATQGFMVKNGATSAGYLRIYEDSDAGSNYVQFDGQALPSNASMYPTYTASIDVNNAEIKALAATPMELVATHGAGTLIEVIKAVLVLDYGSEVLAEPSAPDDLALEYDDGTGQQIVTWDTTGFITSSADAIEIVAGGSVGGGASAVTSAANVNKNVVLINTGGEYTGNASNDTALRVIITYRVHDSLGL